MLQEFTENHPSMKLQLSVYGNTCRLWNCGLLYNLCQYYYLFSCVLEENGTSKFPKAYLAPAHIGYIRHFHLPFVTSEQNVGIKAKFHLQSPEGHPAFTASPCAVHSARPLLPQVIQYRLTPGAYFFIYVLYILVLL